MSRRKAFTLIELLVVISIIAVLLAVILPSLKIAKQQAQGIMCLSNLKQLTLAWYAYSEEHNGKLVPGNVLASNTKPVYWVASPQKENGDFPENPCLLEEELRGIERGLLYIYIKDVEAYHCPGDRGKLRFGSGYRSYSVTGLMNGEMTSKKEFVNRHSQISMPVTKCVFVENTSLNRDWNRGSWVMNYDMLIPSWIDPLAIWHNKKSTIGFADGHVEMHRWVDESTIEMAETQIPRNPPVGSEDIAYMIRAYVPGKWSRSSVVE